VQPGEDLVAFGGETLVRADGAQTRPTNNPKSGTEPNVVAERRATS
jgi:hypothetical protein